MSEKLKPCPFCGGEAKAFFCEESGTYDVQCQQCGALPFLGRRRGSGRFKSMDDVIAAWNRRDGSACEQRRTCRVDSSHVEWERGAYSYLEVELSCGHAFTWDDGTPPDHCPYCGARIIRERRQTMPTDDERRAVARRLRRSRSEWFGMGWRLWLGPKFCAVVLSDGNRDELEDAAHLLADLIEPSDPKVKCVAEVKVDGERLEELAHDAAVELTGIDRDALLALADELEEEAGSVCGVCMGKTARRIREACGEVER